MNILIPQGIGDAAWALMKAESVAAAHGACGAIDVFIQHLHGGPAEFRALEFVKRFAFVRSAGGYRTSILKDGPPCDDRGIPRYIDCGPHQFPGIDYVMVPNRHLDCGGRLEDWLPEHAINWRVMEQFSFTLSELDFADELRASCPTGEYAVFYLGPLSGNTTEGHNRGGVWRPADWVRLGNWAADRLGVRVVLVGGDDDVSYADDHVRPLLAPAEARNWVSLVGRTGIGKTLAVARKARFVISYQSGVGMVPQYMGVPGGVFFRRFGDSLSPTAMRTADDAMISGWANPQHIADGKHLPLRYGEHDVDYIGQEILKRGW